jgi:hypothetical protein
MSAKKLEQPQFEVGTKVVVNSDNHWQGVAVVTAVRELEPQYLVSIPNTPLSIYFYEEELNYLD